MDSRRRVTKYSLLFQKGEELILMIHQGIISEAPQVPSARVHTMVKTLSVNLAIRWSQSLSSTV